jgi:hypothetical protein
MINKKTILLTSLLTMAMSFSAEANKPIYKWKDSAGNLKYTQSKPPRGTDYDVIYQRQSDSSQQKQNNAESKQQTQNTSTQSQDDIIAQQEAAKKANEEIRKKNCTIAKNNLDSLQNNRRIFVKEGDGRRVLTDEEKSSRLDETKKDIEEYCN